MFAPQFSAQDRDELMRPTVMEKEEIKVHTALDLASSYKDRHVIVTGASGSVGQEVIKTLLESGAKVVVFGRDSENMNYISKHYARKGKNFFSYTIDFTLHPLDLESKFREAMKDLGGVLHHLFVCHGYIMPGTIKSLNLKDWDRCMNVNVRSVFMVVSLATPFLKLTKDEDPSI
jgi:NAD(P)-dependent dehydrogenase (short-subunit alcohol dehydrogenase family)